MARTRLQLLLVFVTCALGCGDHRLSITRETLGGQIKSQSNGALTLDTMTKTNGLDHEREGVKLYTLEWQAKINVAADGWKAGWRDYEVLPTEPNALAAAVEGASVRRLLQGGTVDLQGTSELQKAERGWRVVETTVKSFRINAPPELAPLLGIWHIPEKSAVFRVEYDESRGVRALSASIGPDHRLSWGSPWPASFSQGKLRIQYAEGSGTFAQGSSNELSYTEADAFSTTSNTATRVVGGDEAVATLIQADQRRLSNVQVLAKTSASNGAGKHTESSSATGDVGSVKIGQWAMPGDLGFLSTRRISPEELSGLTRADLRRLRNYIYARHGRVFASGDLRRLFENQPWYRIDSRYSDSMLSPTESANASLIATAEQSRR